MPTCRSRPLLTALVVLPVAGCATGYAPQAPQAVSLAGNWRLDHAASEDPQQLLERLRAQARKIIERQRAAYGGQRPGSEPPPPSPMESEMASGHDPLRRSPMAHIIQDAVARGDFLTIRQSADSFVLDYGTTVRRFTPGARSVVSAEGGVGDQSSGWKGREYVITVKAQMGPTVTESYGLASDGKHLVDKLTISNAELPGVTLTRQYAPSNEVAPRVVPSTD
ncbi:MAG: hypothetical protein JOZ67_04245 [Gammaproteobacteria bacterium]|nr:hypothetical protein [Gammaproteobacteria bacterium]MBV9697636.1 hypothetical protein [Gammaproteobacteria bacterium]